MASSGVTGPSGLNKLNQGVPASQVVGNSPIDKNSKGKVGGATGLPGALEFKKALEQFSDLGTSATSPTVNTGLTQKPSAVTAPKAAGAVQSLKFSNHAIERMHSRGISFSPDEMRGIENAIAKAAAKGSKDTLVLSGGNALIVSVKNSTVVTVMDKAAMKENVFTNIDSTVVL